MFRQYLPFPWLVILLLCLSRGHGQQGAMAGQPVKRQDFMAIPKATKIPPTFYEFKVKEEPKIESPPDPKPPPKPVIPPEPELPAVIYHDPRPTLLEHQTQRRLEKRRRQQAPLPMRVRPRYEQEKVYAKDPHYRQWDQSILEDKLTYPVDRNWVLTADRYLSGVLETDIHSQVAGTVIVVMDRPLFAARGWQVIFPQYTKLICEYQPLSKVSDTRLSLKCNRALRPDGASVMLTEAHGADLMGRNGLVGDIDYRTLEKYGSAFTMSVLAALAHSSSRASRSPLAQEGTTQLSQNLGQVTAQLLDQYIDLAPLITLEAGTRVHIRPQVDIWLRPPLSQQEWQDLKDKKEHQQEQNP